MTWSPKKSDEQLNINKGIKLNDKLWQSECERKRESHLCNGIICRTHQFWLKLLVRCCRPKLCAQPILINSIIIYLIFPLFRSLAPLIDAKQKCPGSALYFRPKLAQFGKLMPFLLHSFRSLYGMKWNKEKNTYIHFIYYILLIIIIKQITEQRWAKVLLLTKHIEILAF